MVKIMKEDKHNICSNWHALLRKDLPDTCITPRHLGKLMEGLKGWLPDGNVQTLTSFVSNLKDDLDNDGAQIYQLQRALYLFQEAVKMVLKKHSIKPHWMFALDNLAGNAVKAAVNVLSPELAVHLTEPVEPRLEGMQLDLDHTAESTSGVSTVNSGPGVNTSTQQRMVSRLNRVREDNRQLLCDLLKAQTDYHELLKQSLSEQRLHLHMLSQNLAASSLQPVRDQEDVTGDPDLLSWLQGLALDQTSVDIFIGEDLTLNDVLELMSRDDLKRLRLKAGPELRIWRAILTHRGIPTTPTP